MRSMIKNDYGFTLIELMVVIIVLGVLASIAIPKFLGVKEQAKEVEAEALGRNIRTAMEVYYQNNLGYPNASNINNFNDSLISFSSILGISTLRISNSLLGTAVIM